MRPKPIFTVPARHTVLGTPLLGPYPEGLEIADFALGCFWGASARSGSSRASTRRSRLSGRLHREPHIRRVCSGLTGHTETVRVSTPEKISYERLLQVFWESHDPTQGFRQGNDVGTQYRSAIHTHSPPRRPRRGRPARRTRRSSPTRATAASPRNCSRGGPRVLSGRDTTSSTFRAAKTRADTAAWVERRVLPDRLSAEG
ncbi:hypothetical protein E4K10_26305 [Streptomyces sp. T1317-0309]|nr:hypothetical protein E4K10_26305 [Streptomyces sp. T1317-0309]